MIFDDCVDFFNHVYWSLRPRVSALILSQIEAWEIAFASERTMRLRRILIVASGVAMPIRIAFTVFGVFRGYACIASNAFVVLRMDVVHPLASSQHCSHSLTSARDVPGATRNPCSTVRTLVWYGLVPKRGFGLTSSLCLLRSKYAAEVWRATTGTQKRARNARMRF